MQFCMQTNNKSRLDNEKKKRNKVVNMLYFQDAILHQKPSLNCIFWQTLRHFVKQYLVFHDHSQFYLAKETCVCDWNSRRHYVKFISSFFLKIGTTSIPTKSQNPFFSKHQNEAEFENLNNSDVLSSGPFFVEWIIKNPRRL